jgi:hypothetical protein
MRTEANGSQLETIFESVCELRRHVGCEMVVAVVYEVKF